MVERGIADGAWQQSSLGDGEFIEVLAEVLLGRCFDPVRVGSKEHRVRPEFEYLVLVVATFEFSCNNSLADLAFDGWLCPKEVLLHDLLGDRGPTSATLACRLGQRRTANRGEIDSAVFIEGLVLSREQRGDDQVRRLIEADRQRVPLGHPAKFDAIGRPHDGERGQVGKRQIELGSVTEIVLGDRLNRSIRRIDPEERKEPDPRRREYDDHSQADERGKTAPAPFPCLDLADLWLHRVVRPCLRHRCTRYHRLPYELRTDLR